ncbi:glycosyl transferase family 21-domain-containing protein, partial [Gaertneriomyces semiglobifer]
VTILRPLKGVDCNMSENLSSSFCQEYPVFELIFSVADPVDPAIDVVRKLMKQYPHVGARLIIGDEETGVNPKINNMVKGYESAKYDIVWILDSNVRVSPGCMARSVAELGKPGIGLVHHLPCGVSPQRYGSRLEQAFLNTAHAKMYVTINKIAIASCLIGKSNMFRKSDLADLGGLRHFGKFMAEDNIMGEALWAKGLRHSMTTDRAYQTLGSISIAEYFKRRARWIRIRKYTVTVATLVEPLTESVLNGILTLWAFSRLTDVSLPYVLLAHYSLWIASDWTIAATLDPVSRREFGTFISAWFIRELAALPLWLFAMLGSTVEWRGRHYFLNSDGTVQPARTGGTTRLLQWLFKKQGRQGPVKDKWDSPSMPTSLRSHKLHISERIN